MGTTIMIADDHPVVREGLRSLIGRERDMKIVGEAADGLELLNLAARTSADVYVVDIVMPLLNGLEAARRLTKWNPEAGIVVLSLHNSGDFVEQALDAGVRGYVTKESVSRDIVWAIRHVKDGHFFASAGIPRGIRNSVLSRNTIAPRAGKRAGMLTSRQRQILQLIAEGFTSKEVGDKLDLSVNTVHVHRANIMARLKVHTQAELVRYALKEGIATL